LIDFVQLKNLPRNTM